MGFFLGKLVTNDHWDFSIIVEKEVLARLKELVVAHFCLVQWALPTLPLSWIKCSSSTIGWVMFSRDAIKTSSIESCLYLGSSTVLTERARGIFIVELPTLKSKWPCKDFSYKSLMIGLSIKRVISEVSYMWKSRHISELFMLIGITLNTPLLSRIVSKEVCKCFCDGVKDVLG